MGDRGNIAVIQSEGDQVWLYSHWGGTELPERLQTGLKAGKGRWNDESYLTKIIFRDAVRDWSGDTGYGISCRMQDNEHTILVVDIPGKQVFLISENELSDRRIPKDYKPTLGDWSFEDFSNTSSLPKI